MKLPIWMERGYIALFALLPWSTDQDFGNWNMSLPTEPLIGALGIALAWLFCLNPRLFYERIRQNLFLQISFVLILWMAVTACFSALPLVSWKYWIITAAYWWVFALGISIWPEIWRRSFPWLLGSMMGLGLYTLIHHAFYHFRADQAMLAPMPFFPDHTMLAAALAMFIFLLGTQPGWKPGWPKRRSGIAPWQGSASKAYVLIKWISLILFLTVLLASTCRAAWVSVWISVGVCCFFIRWKPGLYILLLSLSGALLIAMYTGAFTSRDVSALERLNRWSCALRMVQQRPLVGFGPGTFKFEYLDFQKPEEMTRISLLKPILKRGPDNYGRGGGAHSEYLQALAETGWPGFLLLSGLVLNVLWLGFRHAANKKVLPFLLAIVTFWTHGAVNEFLHDDCMAALVWGSMAMLITSKKNPKPFLDFQGD